MIPHLTPYGVCAAEHALAWLSAVCWAGVTPSRRARCSDGMAWHGVAASVRWCYGATVCREGGVATVFSSHDRQRATSELYQVTLIAFMHPTYPTCSPHLHTQYNHTRSAMPTRRADTSPPTDAMYKPTRTERPDQHQATALL